MLVCIFAHRKPKIRPTPINKRKYKDFRIVHLEARLAEMSVAEPGEDALAEDVAVGLQGGVASSQDVQPSVELLHRVHRGYWRSTSVKILSYISTFAELFR